MKTMDKPGLVPGDGKVIVGYDPEVRVYPCEVDAYFRAKKEPGRPGYFQTPVGEGPPLQHFHSEPIS